MSIVTVCGLEPSLKAAFKGRVGERKRSMESAIRMVSTSVTTQSMCKLGLAELMRNHLGGTTLDLAESNEFQRVVFVQS